MKKLFLLFLLMTNFVLFAQESKGILYKATKGEKVIYFLGDIDISAKEIGTLDKTIINAYKDSEVLVMNSSPNDPDESMPVDEAMAKFGTYKLGTIENYVPKEIIDLIKERYKELNFYPKNFSKIKLWVHCGFVIMGQQDIVYPEGMDGISKYLLDNLGDKPIIGIFKPNEYFEDVMKIPEEVAKFGLSIPLEKVISNEKTKIEAWKSGNEELIKTIFKDSNPDETDPVFSGIEEGGGNIDDLNRKFKLLLESKLQNYRNIFVLLEAYHFFDNEMTLFKELSNIGYKVERIN